jgi:regulator of nonsense transcripts 2
MLLLEQELPECNRREQIDEIAEKFCTNHGSSKNSRKRLLKTLFLVPRSRLDLLPYYSRMVATLDRVWNDIAPSLVTDLEQQFHGQAKFKKNQNIESRMRTARYIGELTKFRAAPPIIALRCLERCIEDFTGSNVEVACCILESCGRYLYRTKHANAKATALMETMTRLSKAKVCGSTAGVDTKSLRVALERYTKPLCPVVLFRILTNVCNPF